MHIHMLASFRLLKLANILHLIMTQVEGYSEDLAEQMYP